MPYTFLEISHTLCSCQFIKCIVLLCCEEAPNSRLAIGCQGDVSRQHSARWRQLERLLVTVLRFLFYTKTITSNITIKNIFTALACFEDFLRSPTDTCDPVACRGSRVLDDDLHLALLTNQARSKVQHLFVERERRDDKTRVK